MHRVGFKSILVVVILAVIACAVAFLYLQWTLHEQFSPPPPEKQPTPSKLPPSQQPIHPPSSQKSSPRQQPPSQFPELEVGPFEYDKFYYYIIWVPCNCAGDRGIATLVAYPKEPRYNEGAPIVVSVQGGHTPGNLMPPSPGADLYGIVWVNFLFPGGRYEDYTSGGTFDYNGPCCHEALYSVLMYVQGKLTNTAGKKITDYVSYPLLLDEVGLIGNSNGGNMVGQVLAKYSSGLEGVKYVIFYESPVGPHYILGDLGRKGDDPDPRVDGDGDGVPWDDARNLKYVEGSCDESSCEVDFSTLRFDPQVGFYLDNNGNGKPDYIGQFPHVKTDVDGSGAIEEDEDFIFMYMRIPSERGVKRIYSYIVTKAAQDLGLFTNIPEYVARPEEALEFWRERAINYRYDELARYSSQVKVMQLGFEEDHVQATRDHPHIVVNYNAFRKRGFWVRLNPDKSYLELVAGSLPSTVKENPANIDLSFYNIGEYLLRYRNIRAVMYASVLEMADRTHYNEWSNDLENVLAGGTRLANMCSYEVEVVEGYLVTAPNGNKLYVRIYQPKTSLYNARFPAVIFVGGGRGEGVIGPPLSEGRKLGDVAKLGIIEVYFNPQGVGPPQYKSEGEPNFGGYQQQDDLKAVVEYTMSLPNVDSNNVGIVSFSFGIATAAGCLGRYPELGVKYLIDIEGPSDSVIAAMDYGTKEQQEAFYRSFGHYSLAKDSSTENQVWWAEREAYRYIGNFTGAYLRLQGEIDHIQPRGVYEHALKMNNEAVKGKPWWVRIGLADQGNPVNKIYPLNDPSQYPNWIPGRLADKWGIVVRSAILEMVEMFGEIPQVCGGVTQREKGKVVVHDVDMLDNGNFLLTIFTIGGGPSSVVEVDRSGNIVWEYRGLNFAHSAEVWEDLVLISDTGNDRVIIVDKRTNQIVWNSDDITLSDGSRLNYPNDADFITDDRILITDRNNHRVIEIDLNGNILWQFGETGIPGSDNTHLNFPHNADRLPNGNTIICDSENDRIIEIDPSGNIVWIYQNGLNWPRDADRLSNNNTLIVDSRNGRVLEVTPSGEVVWSYGGLRLPYDADLLPDGTILISDSARGRVIIVDKDGNVLWELTLPL